MILEGKSRTEIEFLEILSEIKKSKSFFSCNIGTVSYILEIMP